MKILVWSTNPVKVNAVKSCVEKYPHFQNMQVEVVWVNVNSEVSDMPLSRDEILLGARNRAHNLRKSYDADLYVGMEWWADQIGKKAYLYGVTHILSTSWEEHIGFSAAIEIPHQIQVWIFVHGQELGPLQDKISGEKDTKKKLWSHGMWSDSMMNRQFEFETAFFCAISPFYNKYYISWKS